MVPLGSAFAPGPDPGERSEHPDVLPLPRSTTPTMIAARRLALVHVLDARPTCALYESRSRPEQRQRQRQRLERALRALYLSFPPKGGKGFPELNAGRRQRLPGKPGSAEASRVGVQETA